MTIYRITVRDEGSKKPIDVSEFVGTEAEMEKHADKLMLRWSEADVKVDEVDEIEGHIHLKDHPLDKLRASLVETLTTGQHRIRLLDGRSVLRRNDGCTFAGKDPSLSALLTRCIEHLRANPHASEWAKR
jgi:hypothetical protein